MLKILTLKPLLFQTTLILGLLSLNLSLNTIQAAVDHDRDSPLQPTSDPFLSLSLSPALQKSAGIKVQPLVITRHQPEVIRYGRTLPQEPLLQFKSDYFQQQARLKKAYRQKQLAKTQHSRLQAEADNAQWLAESITLNTVRSAAELQWGKKIVTALTEIEPSSTIDFSDRSKTLLYVDCPVDEKRPMPATIAIAHRAYRSQAVTATLIDPKPTTPPAHSGLRFFYQTTTPIFLPGQPLVAFIPLTEQAISGIVIPETAIIQHLGQHFIYLKKDETTFNRQQISVNHPVPGGILVTTPLTSPYGVVTRGAQMLFSEEFKAGIPEENDNDDD